MEAPVLFSVKYLWYILLLKKQGDKRSEDSV